MNEQVERNSDKEFWIINGERRLSKLAFYLRSRDELNPRKNI